MTSTNRRDMRLFTTTIYLSLVGLLSTLGSLWVLTHGVEGRALLWVTWLSVLGAFVALPGSILLARRLSPSPVLRRERLRFDGYAGVRA